MADLDFSESLWFVFHETRFLLIATGGRYVVPSQSVIRDVDIEFDRAHRVGEIDGISCCALSISDLTDLPELFEWVGLRESFGLLEERHFGMAGRAFQILEWDRNHRFCGRCGAETEYQASEWAKRCPECDLMSYPRLSPAVIMRITKGNKLLLTHAPHHPDGMYTVPAGFVEPGETLEEAVAREIKEEVGIEIANIQYFGSQPWPFPHQLMIAFTAEHRSGKLEVDGIEIVEAMWCSADKLPKIPGKISISRALIDSFVDSQRT